MAEQEQSDTEQEQRVGNALHSMTLLRRGDARFSEAERSTASHSKAEALRSMAL